MNTKNLVLVFTAVLSLTILALSLLLLRDAFSLPSDRLGPVKDTFDLAVVKVLLPMFTTVVTAALTYIFGKQLISAVSERIRANTGKDLSEKTR